VSVVAFPGVDDTLLDELPDETWTVEAAADWYARHAAEISRLRSVFYRVSQRLTTAIRDRGPLATSAGLLQILPDGYDWDDEAISALPQMARDDAEREQLKALKQNLLVLAEVTFVGQTADIERALEMVLEEFPQMTFGIKRKVDKTRAARVIRQPGRAGELVSACRTPRGKLGVA
jgi:hypothetical protein